MSLTPKLETAHPFFVLNAKSNINPGRRKKSILLRVWILSGLFFMALPGTLLGFSNLMAISTHHGSGTLPAAWMEGHGHAQMFGWIGSFILGIGFYSQPALHQSAIRLQQACLSFWVSGVALRWFANIYAWHWRMLFPLSAGLELIAVLLFLYAASHHKLPEGVEGETRKSPLEWWMISVLLGTAGLAGRRRCIAAKEGLRVIGNLSAIHRRLIGNAAEGR